MATRFRGSDAQCVRWKGSQSPHVKGKRGRVKSEMGNAIRSAVHFTRAHSEGKRGRAKNEIAQHDLLDISPVHTVSVLPDCFFR